MIFAKNIKTMEYSEKSTMRNWLWFVIPSLITTIAILIIVTVPPDRTIFEHLKHFDSINIYLLVLVIALFFSIRLEWKLNANGFEYRYFPFILKTRTIPFQEIKDATVREISPLKDFGGWGLRKSKKLGNAYTTTGKTILHIHTVSGQKINVTVTNSDKAKKILKDLNISESPLE